MCWYMTAEKEASLGDNGENSILRSSKPCQQANNTGVLINTIKQWDNSTQSRKLKRVTYLIATETKLSLAVSKAFRTWYIQVWSKKQGAGENHNNSHSQHLHAEFWIYVMHWQQESEEQFMIIRNIKHWLVKSTTESGLHGIWKASECSGT